jgi:glycosyltransferase involved in cell wall biosynthesis
MAKPLVSIGMPVYNGEKNIKNALDSLLAQSFSEFELIISDNGSNDETEDICREYKSRDRRIIYIRHEENRGAFFNFNFVLTLSRGEFFMWAAHDDEWDPEFIQRNLEILKSYNDVIASISRVRYKKINCNNRINHGTYALMNGYEANVLKYLKSPGANSRFYALFRKDVLKKSMIKKAFLGADWVIMLNTLVYGKHYELDEVLFYRNYYGVSFNFRNLIEDKKSFSRIIFPAIDFTFYLLAHRSFNLNLKILRYILKWNLHCTIASINYYRKLASQIFSILG